MATHALGGALHGEELPAPHVDCQSAGESALVGALPEDCPQEGDAVDSIGPAGAGPAGFASGSGGIGYRMEVQFFTLSKAAL